MINLKRLAEVKEIQEGKKIIYLNGTSYKDNQMHQQSVAVIYGEERWSIQITVNKWDKDYSMKTNNNEMEELIALITTIL